MIIISVQLLAKCQWDKCDPFPPLPFHASLIIIICHLDVIISVMRCLKYCINQMDNFFHLLPVKIICGLSALNIVLRTVDISWSNMIRDIWTQYGRKKALTLFRIWTQKRHSIPCSYGQAMVCLSWVLWKKGTTRYQACKCAQKWTDYFATCLLTRNIDLKAARLTVCNAFRNFVRQHDGLPFFIGVSSLNHPYKKFTWDRFHWCFDEKVSCLWDIMGEISC